MSEGKEHSGAPGRGRWRPVPLWLTVVPIIVLVAAVAVAINGVGGTTHHPTQVEALDLTRSTTTSTSTTVPSTTTSVVPTTSTTVTSTTLAAHPAPTHPTTTTSTVRTCYQSNNPACGPFYFSPAPGPDQPLKVTVIMSPAHPAVGQAVTFLVKLDDPDGQIGCIAEESDGVTGTSNECGLPPACDRYGPWPPPAPQPGHEQLTYSETYHQAGNYAFSIQIKPFNTPCVDSKTGRSENPYVSSGAATLPFTVT